SIRNAPTKLMKDLGYGENYKYAHNYEHNFVEAEFLPEEIKATAFYKPGNNKREKALEQFLQVRWKGKYNYYTHKKTANTALKRDSGFFVALRPTLRYSAVGSFLDFRGQNIQL